MQALEQQQQAVAVECDIVNNKEYEWHPHIPHSAIVEAIAPSVVAASQYYSQGRVHSSSLSSHKHHCQMPSILVVGSGNSALPKILHDAFDSIPVSVTCLDYSAICVDMIRSMYKDACPNMSFVVGDASSLQNVVWEEDDYDDTMEKGQQPKNTKQFDIIIDKGLLDALMCGDGFDISKQMQGINEVLTPHDWGLHVLISFELSSASKQCMNDMPGLVWNFDIPIEGSKNGRGCFNLAKRCRATNN